MKAVFIGESSGMSREAIMAVYPRHKQVAKSYVIRDWNDSLLPG
jgi:hypothetical protein